MTSVMYRATRCSACGGRVKGCRPGPVQAYTRTMTKHIRAKTHVFAFDCPDPRALAEFYAALLGWQASVAWPDDEWVTIKPEGDEARGFHLAFQRVSNFKPPVWPDGDIPQQAHLDFWVDSIAEAEPVALSLGAKRHEVQPGKEDGWIVYTDPAGHLFCLCEDD